MSSRRMSTTFYGSKAISAGCNRTDWKFQQNTKYDEISERKTRVIYLCSADNKRLAACAFRHKLSAFLSLMLPRRGTFRTEERGGIVPPQLPSAAQRCNTLDFASKVVCHETPARFLWILSAAVPIVTAKAWPSLLAVPCFLFSCCSRFYSSEGLSSKPKMAVTRAATTMSTAMAMAIAHIVCCKMSSARMVE